MKNIILLLCLIFPAISQGKSMTMFNDAGNLLDNNKFAVRCAQFSYKQDIIYVYGHEPLSCIEVNELYIKTHNQIDNFIIHYLHKPAKSIASKIINIRILTLAELNDPDNFSGTDKKCMYDFKCSTGAYFGRTFYSPYSNVINVYVVYGNYKGYYSQYSFISTFKHELVHAILNKCGLNYNLSDKEEHKIVYAFLEWAKTHSE